ncbi:MAG: hypothetical protein HY852_27075 [Bradyrhizobium sp.]|uniref:hypothetical protein n=1 Tax=Bradyrhizobium sp. TaxID=376 RepID=UPI0025BCF99A|nr:hypothetical protein [Bradyrhizobium sp.]MBI5265473.1 hypothetical protein [Bradyrhizobium sp.]
MIPNDGDVLTYNEDGKVIFYLGCGRGFALHARYPGQAAHEGKARITISTARGKMGFDGEFEEPFEARDPVPMNLATTFRQTYLGYARHDPRVFGDKWNAQKARFLDLLDAKGAITISAGKDSYQLPPIDAGKWHKALKECGN